AWAILQGDAEIGVTTMLTARGIDNGDMLLKASQVRDVSLTCGEMTEKLSQIGADLLLSTLRELEAGTLVPEKQKEEDMTYDPMLQKEMGIIDWTQSGAQVRDRIHGLNPWPACTVPFEGGRLKLLRAQAVEGEGKPGTVLISDSREGLVIACGEGAVRILEMQASGGRAMAAKDYLRGHAIDVGTILEETE
ncbi:MAG: methionyl-tRNA formyltransferase, partial [Clostridia bacterium]|nr:methionyl-tRNA formyltransferase [Clostridia bacterium]